MPPVEIMVLHGGEGDAQRYRCLHLKEQLCLSGGIPSCVADVRDTAPEMAGASAVVVLHRVPFDRYLLKLINRARSAGELVIFDTDDFIFSQSGEERTEALTGPDRVKVALYASEVEQYRRTMESADAILVSTAYLARQALVLGKPVHVHRNAFSLRMLHLSERAYTSRQCTRDRLIIGYASGTATHDRDFRQAKPALQHVLRSYPESTLWIVGPLDVGDGWGALSERIVRVPFVAWEELPALLARFDINIAPLERLNPFCQAKSEVKYIEAGLVRVPTVASKTDAFEFAVRPGDNGFLADSPEDWIEALARLVEDAQLRREMGERAYADVLERYHPLVRGRELIATLDEISQQVHGRPLWPGGLPHPDVEVQIGEAANGDDTRVGYRPAERRSLLQRAVYALRYRGVRIFLMQAWVYAQRCLRQVVGGERSRG